MTTQAPEAPADAWAASSRGDVVDRATRWLSSTALAELLSALDGPTPGTTAASRAALRSWSSNVLDTRRGAERRDAPLAGWPARTRRAVVDAAGALGLLLTGAPRQRSYDALIVLAGATTGNRLRSQLAGELMQTVRCTLIVGAASERPLRGSELESDPAGAGDGTEWRHLLRCMDDVFGPLTPQHVSPPATIGRDLGYVLADGTHLRLMVAPAAAGRRPDTAQQLRYLCDRIPADCRASALLVTSSIYAPYQFFSSAPTLTSNDTGYVELVGTPTATDGDERQLTQRLLQETHAAIDAAVRVIDTS